MTQQAVKLDRFTLAYIECALWSSTDEDGEPLDACFDLSDLAPETLQTMTGDCLDYQSSFGELLTESGLSSEQAGHDFWLTRNGHGAGFWGRGIGDVGQELTEMTKAYGEFNLYVGDDGKLYA